MAANSFDIEAARKAGFNDSQIADELGKTVNFDVAGARKAGIADQAIIGEITANPTYGMSTTDRTVTGIGHGLYGLARSSLKTSPAALVYEKLSGNELLPSNAEIDKPLLNTTAGKVGSAIGESAPFMAVPAGGFAKGVGNIASKVAPKVGNWLSKSLITDAAAGGAVQGAAQQEGDLYTNIKEGALGGTLGGAAIKVIGKINQPVKNFLTDTAKGFAEKAQQMGYQLTPGQLSGNRFVQSIEAMSAGLPFLGTRMKAIENANKLNTNKRALAEVGSTGDSATPEIMGEVKTRIGKEYERLTTDKTISLDQKFVDEIQALRVEQANLSPELRNPKIAELLDTWSILPSKYPGKVAINGEQYQANRSRLGQLAKGAWQNDPGLAQAYKGIQASLDGAAKRSLPPADQKAWEQATKQYSNMKIIAKAIDPGTKDVSAAKIGTEMKRVRPNEFTYGKPGSDAMVDIGQYGQMWKPPIPTSGTTERAIAAAAVMHALNAATTGDPASMASLGRTGLGLLGGGVLQGLALAHPDRITKGIFVNQESIPKTAREVIARAVLTASAQKRLSDQRD
jgi:hypothetical protein